MQSDNIKWSVAAGDVFYSHASGRLYKVVSVGESSDDSLVVTYTRLSGARACFVMGMDIFKDGRFIPVECTWLEEAFTRYYKGRKSEQNN
jgi:hypothetical protein